MKKIILVLAITLFSAGTLVQAQSLKKVLKNYHETMGQEVILKSNSSLTTGKILQMGIELSFKQYAAKPAKFRVEATFQGMTLIQSFNGEKGWGINPFAGQTEAQEMSEDETKSMKVEADFEGVLWNWEEKGHQVTLEENEEIEDSDCFVIKTITNGGDEIYTYLDTETYIPLKTKSRTMRAGQEVETETFMSNYQEIDGYVYPGKVETHMGGQIMMTIVIDEMVLNPEIDQIIFENASK